MPSPLATILFTWAAIHAYVGAFSCMLHVRRPTNREYLAFGLACFGLSTWTVGSALGVDARTLGDAAFALRVSYGGGFAAAAFFCEFACQIRGGARRPIVIAYLVAGVGIAANAAGLLVDAEERTGPALFSLPFAPERITPAHTPLGMILAAAGLACAGYAVLVWSRNVRSQRGLVLVAWAGAVAWLAAVHDTIARILPMRTVDLFEHAGLFPVLAISSLLMRRFVHAADELGRRTDELNRSYGNLRATQEELVRKEQLAAVGELSAVIAHEVRNPLAIIKNAVSSLRRSTLRAADRRVLLGILDEEVDRLNRLVRDLLAYARPVEPRGRPIELAAIIEEAAKKSAGAHEEPSSVELELDLGRCPTIHGDPDLLRQALANVFDNALSAMPNGGLLRVLAEPTRLGGSGAVAIEIADSGDGMDTLVLSKARDPFFTTRAAGTGLGLAIVERVVKNHGGVISIESTPGAGTSVRVVLPKARPSSAPPPSEGP